MLAHHRSWNEDIPSFPTVCHSSKSTSPVLSNLKGQAAIITWPRERKCVLRNSSISLISIDKSTLDVTRLSPGFYNRPGTILNISTIYLK